MSDIAIKVENLSKRYPSTPLRAGRFGAKEEQHDTFAGALLYQLRHPARNLRRLHCLSTFSQTGHGRTDEDEKYEIAIVIDDDYWGLGIKIFREIMNWAKELDHRTVFIHFLHTRPEYKFLRKISKNVYESELLGSKFTTYELAVE